MKQIIILLLSIAFIACSPQKRLNMLAEKHPELFKVDTAWRYDTTYITAMQFDTVLKAGITMDTVILHDSIMTIRYYNDGKTVYIKGETNNIAVVKKVPYFIKAPVIRETKHELPWWVWPLIILLTVCIIILALKSQRVEVVHTGYQPTQDNASDTPPGDSGT